MLWLAEGEAVRMGSTPATKVTAVAVVRECLAWLRSLRRRPYAIPKAARAAYAAAFGRGLRRVAPAAGLPSSGMIAGMIRRPCVSFARRVLRRLSFAGVLQARGEILGHLLRKLVHLRFGRHEDYHRFFCGEVAHRDGIGCEVQREHGSGDVAEASRDISSAVMLLPSVLRSPRARSWSPG